MSGEAYLLKEDVEIFNTYSAASKASCKLADSGSAKIVPSELKLYEGTIEGDKKDPHPGYKKVVGVGLVSGADVVRLDIEKPFNTKAPENKGKTFKGIHFNAKQLGKNAKKLAAVIRDTALIDPITGWPKMHEADRVALYKRYLMGLEHHDAQYIWKWWSTGELPPH